MLKNWLINKKSVILEILCILIIISIVLLVNNSNKTTSDKLLKEDIYYEFHQSLEILKGHNPYNKILEGNLLENKKYATLFPHYYYFLGTIVSFSDFRFIPFVTNYQVVLQVIQVIGIITLYQIFRKRNQKLLGLLAIAFFGLNRWSLNNMSILKQDNIALTLLLGSLYLFDTDKIKSYILFGLSLGIKHLGIFIVPLYLLPIFSKKDFKIEMQNLMVLAATVCLPMIPFLVDNLKSFWLSMIFSFTRKPASACGVNPSGFENLLVNYENLGEKFAMFYLLLPRLPLVTLITTNIGLFAFKKINKYQYILATFIVFAALNPVYFDQYLLWITPFVFLTANES